MTAPMKVVVLNGSPQACRRRPPKTSAISKPPIYLS